MTRSYEMKRGPDISKCPQHLWFPEGRVRIIGSNPILLTGSNRGPVRNQGVCGEKNVWAVHTAGSTQNPVYMQTITDGKAEQCKMTGKAEQYKMRGKYASVRHIYMLGQQAGLHAGFTMFQHAACR